VSQWINCSGTCFMIWNITCGLHLYTVSYGILVRPNEVMHYSLQLLRIMTWNVYSKTHGYVSAISPVRMFRSSALSFSHLSCIERHLVFFGITVHILFQYLSTWAKVKNSWCHMQFYIGEGLDETLLWWDDRLSVLWPLSAVHMISSTLIDVLRPFMLWFCSHMFDLL
jgi:hypothetical protein